MWELLFRPVGARLTTALNPRACALGCILLPLRGSKKYYLAALGGQPRRLSLRNFKLLPQFSRTDLLRYDPAGDAVAGASGGIGLHVVSFGVDDDGRASVGEQRMRSITEGHVFVLYTRARFSLRIDGKVQHVAGVVAFRILESVLFAVGIEVRARRLEIGSIALWVLMEMDGVLAERKIVQLQLEGDTGSFWRKGDGADVFSLRILDRDFGFGGAGKRGYG